MRSATARPTRVSHAATPSVFPFRRRGTTPQTGACTSLRSWVVGIGTVPLLAGLLSACGSTSASTPAASQGSSKVCQQVAAVLSDGPDPDSDPVGYALAQVAPLRQIRATSTSTVGKAIDQLASAYEQFYQADGTGASVKKAVTTASNRVGTLCPGSTS